MIIALPGDGASAIPSLGIPSLSAITSYHPLTSDKLSRQLRPVGSLHPFGLDISDLRQSYPTQVYKLAYRIFLFDLGFPNNGNTLTFLKNTIIIRNIPF